MTEVIPYKRGFYLKKLTKQKYRFNTMLQKEQITPNPLGGEVEKGKVKILSSEKETGVSNLPSCIVQPVQLDLSNPTVLKPVFDSETLIVSIDLLSPHKVIKSTYRTKNLNYLKLTLQVARQLNAIDVVKKGDKYFIVDGISLYLAAKQLGLETMRVRVLDLTDKEVKALRAHKNVKTKRSFSEQMELVNLMLESLGTSQGKKRNMEEVLQICDIVESQDVLSDRFELARSVLDLDMSAGTLRKAVKVYEFEEYGTPEMKGLELSKKIDSNKLSIDAAFNHVKNFNKSYQERNEPNVLEEIQLYQNEQNWFKLFNKSCEDLSDLEDESVQTVILSCPYWRQRVYVKGVATSDFQFGREKTPEEYVENSLKFYRPLKRVMKKNGNLFINIAESYSDGHCASVVSKLIVAMENDGWYLSQLTIWKKSNPKPVGGKIKRLRPSTEVILNFSLDKDDRFYRPFRLWDRTVPMTLQGGCNDEIEGDKKQKKEKFSLDKSVISFTDFLDEQQVYGVISGSVVNKSQLKKIDSEFNHIAPSPEYISAIPILTTTKPGDVVLDIFAGTSSLLTLPLKMKRNVIGFDTDPRCIDFSKKHLQRVLDGQYDDSDIEYIESNYLIAA